MTNPFEVQDGIFVVLINDQGQYSLWPATAETPIGWAVACERTRRDACLEYIGKNWTDMRPRTVVAIRPE